MRGEGEEGKEGRPLDSGDEDFASHPPTLPCSAAERRLKMCDDAFREQLEAKERSHDSHVTKLVQQQKKEIHEANQRVRVYIASWGGNSIGN